MALLLNILKIIGIVILVILAVLLVLLLLVLFVPVIYKAEGQKQEQLHVKVRFSWLFPLAYCRLKYENPLKETPEKQDKLSCKIYLLGIPIYNVFGEKKAKKEKPVKEKKKEKGKKEKIRKEKVKKDKNKNTEDKNTKNNIPTEVYSNQNIQKPQQYEASKEKADRENNSQKTNNSKIKNFFMKIKLFIQKLFEKIRNIKYTILDIKEKLENLQDTVSWYAEVLKREESRSAISKGKTQLLKLLKHIGPKKLKGNVVFGFDDPAITGEVLGIVSMFYALYGNHITIIPVFDRTVLQGDFFIKGRVRFFTLLKIGWRILFDKDIKKLYNILTGGKDNE